MEQFHTQIDQDGSIQAKLTNPRRIRSTKTNPRRHPEDSTPSKSPLKTKKNHRYHLSITVFPCTAFLLRKLTGSIPEVKLTGTSGPMRSFPREPNLWLVRGISKYLLNVVSFPPSLVLIEHPHRAPSSTGKCLYEVSRRWFLGSHKTVPH